MSDSKTLKTYFVHTTHGSPLRLVADTQQLDGEWMNFVCDEQLAARVHLNHVTAIVTEEVLKNALEKVESSRRPAGFGA